MSDFPAMIGKKSGKHAILLFNWEIQSETTKQILRRLWEMLLFTSGD